MVIYGPERQHVRSREREDESGSRELGLTTVFRDSDLRGVQTPVLVACFGLLLTFPQTRVGAQLLAPTAHPDPQIVLQATTPGWLTLAIDLPEGWHTY